jgi:transcriptional regulator with XRE-family HTH domain
MDDDLNVRRMAEQIGAVVQRLRRARGWSQTQLARAIDMHRTTISAVESGTRNHDLHTIQKIADALGVPIGEITGAEGEAELTQDALTIARIYQDLDVQDRAAVKRIVLSFASKPTSSQ